MSELRGCWLSVDEICKVLQFGSIATYRWLCRSATFTQIMQWQRKLKHEKVYVWVAEDNASYGSNSRPVNMQVKVEIDDPV